MGHFRITLFVELIFKPGLHTRTIYMHTVIPAAENLPELLIRKVSIPVSTCGLESQDCSWVLA